MKRTKASILTLASLGVLVIPSLAYAIPERAAEAQAAATTARETAQTTATEARAQAETRLADAKLKACQNREKAINNIMQRIADRGQKQLNLFSSIATKVETFYTTKGKTLSNYDSLVADVSAKKTAAQTTVDQVKSDSVSFKCDGTDPKGAASSFQSDLKAEISALQAYKTSVKNLIVGVKSVESTTSSADNTTNTNSTTGGQQ